jgi:hypothetical protein
MVKVEITVVQKCFFPELAEEYLTEGRKPGLRCSTKATFVYEGGAMMPEGFSPGRGSTCTGRVNTSVRSRRGNHWYRNAASGLPAARMVCDRLCSSCGRLPEDAGED